MSDDRGAMLCGDCGSPMFRLYTVTRSHWVLDKVLLKWRCTRNPYHTDQETYRWKFRWQTT